MALEISVKLWAEICRMSNPSTKEAWESERIYIISAILVENVQEEGERNEYWVSQSTLSPSSFTY